MADPATLPVSDSKSADPSAASAAASVALEFEPSSQQADMAQGAALAAPSTSVSGVMGLVTSVRERGSRVLQTQKPWAELFDRTAFSKPASLGEATSRLQKNATHYRTNYLVFVSAIMAMAFVTNPIALMWTGLLGVGWVYLFLVRTQPLVIQGREYSDREKLIGMSILSFVVIFFLTNVASVVLYGASLSAAMIAAHAVFREPDDLFLDEGATGADNLFGNVNFLAGAQAYAQGQPQTGSNMV